MQPALPTAAACITYGCSLHAPRLQSACPTVAACMPCGCSLHALRLQGKAWASVSDEAKDFIAKVLVQNPKARLTGKQARGKEWVATSNCGLNETLVNHGKQRLLYTWSCVYMVQTNTVLP